MSPRSRDRSGGQRRGLPEQIRPAGVLPTGRWTGVAGLALLPVGLGVLLRHPPLLLVGAVGVAYAAYARGDSAPRPELDITRELSDPSPAPGDEVTVTLRVRNAGDGVVPDLRLVDGVPPALASDDPARLGTALRPGKSATLRYTVTAVRGAHEWRPVHVVTRNPSGSQEHDEQQTVETTMRCAPELTASGALPLRGLTTPYAGRVATDVGGAGLEFHSTREYRHGDPARRVNWARYARTGELSTLQFREERAATVVLCIDARPEAYLARDAEEANAVERGVDAASQAFSALVDTGDRVGVAAFAPGDCWLPPSTGSDHRAEARDLLATHPSLAPTPTDDRFLPTTWLKRFRRRLPADAQVILFSPVPDDFSVTVARRLDAYGHAVTVISPDPTAGDTPGRQLARVERAARLSALRGAGLRVVDWGEEALATELDRAAARWSR
ncbi:DUF58 domain-containing protein [Candidatus Halobonum tyrrellensis]|uniref:DUF58 domain-containing protein n=1 Tax=Candidatus Halobonum tyrrellensis G22 TaxID=1324957 RepID=V4IYB1_9EURY|nr:DUF58 domain-containing protein [Candidatus Halobonum tyrrellensis]ESP88137.1 hypothetical protein K933_10617 [Candidatus Halobonum tyrrellensis G22]